MRRLFAIATSVAILLALLAPTVLAADPVTTTGNLVVSVNGSVDVPADQRLETLVVIDGNARVGGEVETLVVAGGTATLTGATVRSIVVVDGTADLQAGTTVLGSVRTLHGTVMQEDSAAVLGSVTTLDGDLAALGLLLVPIFFLLLLGFGLATVAAALLVAAFGARQVRGVESLIARQPGQVLVAGIVGAVALPALAFVLMMTVVGAPIGFGLLFVVLPALAFLAWLVAAIWIGDWLVGRVRGSHEAERPYVAAVLGVIALGIAGMFPFVTAIATLFGFGGLLLAAWRILRPEAPPLGHAGTTQPAPSAG